MFVSETLRNSYLMKMPLEERKNVLLSEFNSFPGDKNNCSLEEIIKFLDEKIVKTYFFFSSSYFSKGYKNFSKEITDRIWAQVKLNDHKINIENFISLIINLEDTLHFQIQLDNERIMDLKKKKAELQSWIEDQTNNFREDIHSNPLLYINILEASNLESNIDPLVKILCGSEIYKTQIIKNSRNPIWNESYKMLFF